MIEASENALSVGKRYRKPHHTSNASSYGVVVSNHSFSSVHTASLSRTFHPGDVTVRNQSTVCTLQATTLKPLFCCRGCCCSVCLMTVGFDRLQGRLLSRRFAVRTTLWWISHTHTQARTPLLIELPCGGRARHQGPKGIESFPPLNRLDVNHLAKPAAQMRMRRNHSAIFGKMLYRGRTTRWWCPLASFTAD